MAEKYSLYKHCFLYAPILSSKSGILFEIIGSDKFSHTLTTGEIIRVFSVGLVLNMETANMTDCRIEFVKDGIVGPYNLTLPFSVFETRFKRL